MDASPSVHDLAHGSAIHFELLDNLLARDTLDATQTSNGGLFSRLSQDLATVAEPDAERNVAVGLERRSAVEAPAGRTSNIMMLRGSYRGSPLRCSVMDKGDPVRQ